MSPRPLALIAGCGPGLGAHRLRKLYAAGLAAFGLSRHPAEDPRKLMVGLRNADPMTETMMALADVAQADLTLAEQPRSAWTFALDLRPIGEPFLCGPMS